MKRKIFTFLLIAIAGLAACKKDGNDPDIKEYDDQQIQAYIKANSLTGFTKDTNGVYYKIIQPGTGANLEYSDAVNLVYTIKTFDGKYTSADTINNHFHDYLGLLKNDNLPEGLQLAIHNDLKHKDASMRLLIPSHLAYGKAGVTNGSNTLENANIAGNQCLDYYVNVVGDQAKYDDMVIQNYFKRNSITGFTKDPAGYYVKVTSNAGTGTVGEIKEFSNVNVEYTGLLLNDTQFDAGSAVTQIPYSLIDGMRLSLQKYAATGMDIAIIMPSALGYDETANGTIPANSVLRFLYTINSVESN